MGDQRITSDDWLPDFRREFPFGPLPSPGDGAFDAQNIDPALRSLLSNMYTPETSIRQADRYVNDGSSGLAAEPVTQDLHVVLPDADNAIEAERNAVEAERAPISPEQTAVTSTLANAPLRRVSIDDDAPMEPFDETPKAPQYVDKVDRERDILAEKRATGNHYCDNTYYREIESMICNKYARPKEELTENEFKKAIAEYVVKKGGRFLMKDEQNRCFEMDMQDVEQLELPVRDVDINDWDILSERGSKGNHHRGNKRYRKIVMDIQRIYQLDETSRTAKTALSNHIVKHVMNYSGRFLKKDWQGRYFIMSKEKAREKTSQALREMKNFRWILDIEEDEAFYEEANRIAGIVTESHSDADPLPMSADGAVDYEWSQEALDMLRDCLLGDDPQPETSNYHPGQAAVASTLANKVDAREDGMITESLSDADKEKAQ